MPIDAQLLDGTKGCRFPLVLGCEPAGEQTTDFVCFRNVEDGRTVGTSGSSMANRAGWRRCDRVETDHLVFAPFCRDAAADAGSNDASGDAQVP